MNATQRMRAYHQQAVRTATPEQIILKLYDLGVAAAHRGDREKLRAVLVELMGSLDFEQGGEIAGRLCDLYTYCLDESVSGDVQLVGTLLAGLREAWKQGVVACRAA